MKETCRKDAEGILLSTSLLATTIVENMPEEEARYLAEFMLSLGSNIMFLCRFPIGTIVVVEE
ncbi:hypothetical protein LJC20_03345 [Eubacteriales bacterium OttesenSCG-928-M02]|nr:hypothetical protein [Eubacteriales bacterium OttesenSCG-928-M02]